MVKFPSSHSELFHILKHLSRHVFFSIFQDSESRLPFQSNCHTQLGSYHLADSNVRRTAAKVALGSNNHIVERSQIHTQVLPGSEVVARCDSSLGTLVLTNRPVLSEGRSTFNGRLVDSLAGIDVVGAAIASNRALLRCARRGVVGAKVFDYVEFDEWVLGPAIDG